jgi:hypothetical protein
VLPPDLVVAAPVTYPAGAWVRASDICRNPRTGKPGLLPINPATWYKWVKLGRVPPGTRLSEQTVVWSIELVQAIGRGEGFTAQPSMTTAERAGRLPRAVAQAAA